MAPARTARTEQMRLATLLEIGRSLSGATDAAQVRMSVLSALSRLFEADRLFYAEVDSSWQARTVAIATHGSARRADPTYPAVSTAATSDDGCSLDPDAARALAAALGGPADAVGALVVPVRVNGEVCGELGAIRVEGTSYTSEDCDLLAFGAAIIAAALAQRLRFDETESRRREAERLEEIGRAITSSLDLDEVLDRVMSAAIDLTGADSCTVWRNKGDRSDVIASRGRTALPAGFEMDVVPAIVAEISAGRSVQIDDLASDPRLPPMTRATVSDWPRSMVLVPMLSQDGVAGVLTVGHHEPRHYGPASLGILERLALQAAIAVDNARLHAEILDLSLTDPLTGLPNRRHMDMVLKKEFEAARRGRPLAVVLLDLDDFKGYNDAHGHAGGDALLCEFAELLDGETRAMNLAVRYGGDEFLTILSESTADGAAHLIERIEAKVRTHPRLKALTFSAGIATYSKDMKSPQDLVDAADGAMYRDKLSPRTAP